MAMITLMDGGMGQELLRRWNQPPTPLWSARVMMDAPELVQQLHLDFIRAGARMITVNAYSVTRCRLEPQGAGELFGKLQQLACDLANRARDASGVDVTIAGCLPPLKWSYRPDLADPAEREAVAYDEIARLQRRHVDLILCETMASASQARGAALGASDSGLPVWVAWTLADDASGHLRSGDTLAQAQAALDGLPVTARLVNCSKPESVAAALPALTALPGPWGAYANGFTDIATDFAPGTTVTKLAARTDLGPEAYADHAMGWLDAGLTLVGGCCEVGPDHIKALADRLVAQGHSIGGAP